MGRQDCLSPLLSTPSRGLSCLEAISGVAPRMTCPLPLGEAPCYVCALPSGVFGKGAVISGTNVLSASWGVFGSSHTSLGGNCYHYLMQEETGA